MESIKHVFSGKTYHIYQISKPEISGFDVKADFYTLSQQYQTYFNPLTDLEFLGYHRILSPLFYFNFFPKFSGKTPLSPVAKVSLSETFATVDRTVCGSKLHYLS